MGQPFLSLLFLTHLEILEGIHSDTSVRVMKRVLNSLTIVMLVYACTWAFTMLMMLLIAVSFYKLDLLSDLFIISDLEGWRVDLRWEKMKFFGEGWSGGTKGGQKMIFRGRVEGTWSGNKKNLYMKNTNQGDAQEFA
jgi:hypothetical protein